MKTDMTKGNPMKIILLFSIPVLMGNLFQQFYNMVDTIIVGAVSGLKGACGGWLDRLYYVSGAWLCKWNSTGLWSYGKPCVWCEKREAFEALCGFSYHSYCDCFSGAHDSDSACVEAASYLAQYT